MKDLTVLREKFDNHEMILPEEFSDLLDRAEQAEQAVARVREVLEHHTFVADDKYGDLAASQYYGDSELEAVAAKSITRALDGEQA